VVAVSTIMRDTFCSSLTTLGDQYVELEQLTAEPALLGEGPCWHEGEQVLYWVDIWGKSLHCFDPSSGEDRKWELGQYVGTVAPRARGGLILALENGFAFFDPSTGEIDHLPPVDEDAETRFNDGKCDPSGRFWVGSMDNVDEARPLGALYRVDHDGEVHVIERQITISNGLAWSPQGHEMYYIDSPTKRISAYEYEPETGEVSGKRTVITLNDEQGFPDGMTIDAEGMIWLAHWGGQRICRWDPATGNVLETYPTPAPHTSCCCFGGADLQDLYITTARKGLTPEQLEQYPQSGHLFRMRTDVVGAPTYAYGG
jgi:sugar lactone lactonase YvrE